MTDTTSDLARRSLRESKKTSPVRGKLIDYSKSPMASGMEKTTSPNRSKSESQNLHLFDSAEETEENESDTTESSLEQEMTDSSFAPANEVSKLTQRHRPNLSFSTISSPEISEQRRHPPVKNCHKSSTIFFVIATMATLILVVSFFYLLLPFPHQPELASDLPFKVFIQNLKTIRDDFPNQAKRFWATISATLSSILGKPTFPPQEPAVVIFLYRKSNDHQIKSSLERLVSRISRAVQEALQPNDPAEDPVLLRAESYRQESSNAAKKQLDLDINRVFATKTKFSVTLLDLHNLPSEVVTIFYGYCDTELAPYKNVAIFFTLAVEISSDDEEMEIANDFNRWDSLAHEELNKLWKEELNEDKRGPLLARIANSIVFFHP